MLRKRNPPSELVQAYLNLDATTTTTTAVTAYKGKPYIIK